MISSQYGYAPTLSKNGEGLLFRQYFAQFRTEFRRASFALRVRSTQLAQPNFCLQEVAPRRLKLLLSLFLWHRASWLAKALCSLSFSLASRKLPNGKHAAASKACMPRFGVRRTQQTAAADQTMHPTTQSQSCRSGRAGDQQSRIFKTSSTEDRGIAKWENKGNELKGGRRGGQGYVRHRSRFCC